MALDDSLANVLLAPHRSYFNLLYPHLSKVKALAHITGGGFFENIPRVLPADLEAQIQLNSWAPPSFWNLIQSKGQIANEEIYRVFNMGIGMLAIVDKSGVDHFQSSISEPTFMIGELVKGKRKVVLN
jgi:phosphoribosylaminoimidazole (AIR) synthetase